MLNKNQLKQDELENVTGGFGESDLWCYSFEYDFSPDFSNPKRKFGTGYASGAEAKAAMMAEVECLAATHDFRGSYLSIYVRNEVIEPNTSPNIEYSSLR